MTMELYFVYGLLAFMLTVAGIMVEHYVATRWFRKDSLLRNVLRRLEKRFPHMCDDKDTFYCFFKRDVFHQGR